MLEFIKKHKSGIIGTIIFHAIFFIALIILGFTTPLPLPGEEGILINFGDLEIGSGAIEPQKNEEKIPEEKKEKQISSNNVSESEVENLTQDFEEAPEVETQDVSQEETQETNNVQEDVQEEVSEEKEEEEQKVNELAMFHGSNSDSSNDGEGETTDEGNQGSNTGSVNSDNHVGGESMGSDGVNFSLSGRNPESLPLPDYNYQIEGKVVVAITVDKYGNVISVEAGVKGSTTLDAKLLNAAKRAAKRAKFDKKPSAPVHQKGTISYYFKLQ
ncbi:MAG: TonB family protein [Bacteroidota bacterium]|nr:TonB family protein [Bacteroidota bacterium]